MPHEHEVTLSGVASDRALHPRHYGALEGCTGHARIKGPCGDTMEFWVDVESGALRRVGFVTDGCGSARACGDMAAALAVDRPVDHALAVQQADVLSALGGLPPEVEHCALLAANTLHAACRDALEREPVVEPAPGLHRTQEDTP